MNFNHTALRVDVAEDLLPLSAVLHQQGVPHRIFEEGGMQVLKVEDPHLVPRVTTLYNDWRSGKISIELKRKPANAPSAFSQWPVHVAPVTATLIALSVAGFLIYYLRAPREWLSLLTFTGFTLENGQLHFQSQQGQYWRLVTPVFIHFGWLHIVFNSLWLWELGSKIERTLGSLNMFGLFISISLVSNTAQFIYGGAGLFGGMSGVVYGLLGFSWVGERLEPRWQFQLPRPVVLWMIGWLFICLFGVVEVLGFGAVANAAHVGGLIAGALLGAAFGAMSRLSGAED